MRRRNFISLVGGAAAWPLAARAQQRERVRRIGVLMNLTADDPEAQARLAAFLQGLQEGGWAVGRNVRVDIRWSAGDMDLMRRQAAELVALAPDVLLASALATVAVASGHSDDPYRVRGAHRSGRQRFGRELSAARWQCDRLYPGRIRHEREMAGAAQGRGPARDAYRSSVRGRQPRCHATVLRHPGGSGVVRGRVDPGRPA